MTCFAVCLSKNVFTRESQQAKALPNRLSGLFIHARRATLLWFCISWATIAVARVRIVTFVARQLSGLSSSQTERTNEERRHDESSIVFAQPTTQQITKTCSSNFQRYGFREDLGTFSIVLHHSPDFIPFVSRFLRSTLSRASSFLTTMAIEF